MYAKLRSGPQHLRTDFQLHMYSISKYFFYNKCLNIFKIKLLTKCKEKGVVNPFVIYHYKYLSSLIYEIKLKT